MYPACKFVMDYALVWRTMFGEPKRDIANRQGKDNNSTNDLEPVNHFNKNIQHCRNWTILVNTSKHTRTRKNLGGLYRVLLDQVSSISWNLVN